MNIFRQCPLFLLCFLLLLSGCGLPVFVKLAMPESAGFGDDKFNFTADEDNSEGDFRGFELYYRIYPRDANTDIDLKSREELIAHGFRRVSRASAPRETKNDLDKPLIYIEEADRGSAYTVTVNFSNLADATVPLVEDIDPGEATLTVTKNPPGTLTIRREVFYTEAGFTEIFKRFNEIAETDADVTSTIYSELESGPVLLVLYALSFGRAADFTEVYSVPLWIGELEISFPITEPSVP